jgi:hypothetical protein
MNTIDPFAPKDPPEAYCVICKGKLKADWYHKPYDPMTTRFGGPPEYGKFDGYHCPVCGIKYKHAPKGEGK